ncbi:MAG: TIM barrel protein [Thermoguttaceae bacterium]|jgi:sugar phosphate isomerase/epimerase
MAKSSRREFLRQSASLAAALTVAPLARKAAADAHRPDIRFGLVTYMWGAEWDLPTLLENLAKARVLGVELRTTHAHRVEPSLSPPQRQAVKQRFDDSPVKLVGLGTAEDLHHPNPAALEKAIESTKAFIKLSHDVGGSGVKVRPNDLPKGVPVEKTIRQIGKALNLLGAFGADYGQQIRLEVHGGAARLPVIKQIMDVATHPNVGVCWNSNQTDVEKPGLEYNFNLVKDRLGATAHVDALDSKRYPFPELFRLFVKANYRGWFLLEATGKPADRVQALILKRQAFDELLAGAMRN